MINESVYSFPGTTWAAPQRIPWRAAQQNSFLLVAIHTLHWEKGKVVVAGLLDAALDPAGVTQLGVVDDQLRGELVPTGVVVGGEALWGFQRALGADDSEDRTAMEEPDEDLPSCGHGAVEACLGASQHCGILGALGDGVTKAQACEGTKTSP